MMPGRVRAAAAADSSVSYSYLVYGCRSLAGRQSLHVRYARDGRPLVRALAVRGEMRLFINTELRTPARRLE